MRNIALMIVAILAPLAMWISGCRQDSRHAAFPKGPEVKGLARTSAEKNDLAVAPVISAAPIDREVLSTPDQPTFARIRAVLDREAQLSSRNDAPGLFVLPQQQQPSMGSEMAYIQEIHPTTTVPRIIEREFRSRRVEPLPAMSEHYQVIPNDVSAMIPPAPAASVMAEPLILPEAIPGLYMGTDEGVDANFPLSLVPKKNSIPQWQPAASMNRDATIGSDSALAMPQSVSIDELHFVMRELDGLLSPRSESTQKLANASTLPLPIPPIAMSQEASDFTAMLAAKSNKNDIRRALEPLPDISTLPPLPPLLSEPEDILASLAKTGEKEIAGVTADDFFMPEPPQSSPQVSVLSSRERFMMDVWNDKPTLPVTLSEKISDPVETNAPILLLDVPELVLDKPMETKISEITQESNVDKKVPVVPLRSTASKSKARLSSIDSAVNAPPMDF